ncbi:CD177 antigen-like [Antechinus flavipes]|uniref:CD177 antigen-like n=1 Tax=Antechinus flavipes TaxID=38775 RepID=UPI0022364654|nr:CD177 antigen-like [Antechinus flavipes]
MLPSAVPPFLLPISPSHHSCPSPQHATLPLPPGPVVASFRSKGCILPGLQTTGVSQYRQPPEVSITLYVHMCPTDLCNDDSTSASLWNVSVGSRPPNSSYSVPSGLRCQACAALESCPEDSPLVTCPGSIGCYRGILKLITSNASLPLALWGCGSWSNCSLLEGFWTPGPIALSEACEDEEERRHLMGRWAMKNTGVSLGLGPAWQVRLGSLLALGGRFLTWL